MAAIRKTKVLLSLITPDIDYQLEQAAVAELAAGKLRIALNIEFADNDGVYQTLQLLKVIQSPPEVRPDAIVVEPVGTNMVQVAQAAAAADIAWVILNRDADYISRLRAQTKVPVFAVSTDNEAVGRIQGEQMNALAPEGGNVLYLEGPANSDAVRHRNKGMLAIKRPDIRLKRLRGGWTEAGAHRAVQSWLQLSTNRDRKLDAIICQNDTMAIGARRAFREVPDPANRGKFLSLPFTGCDGVPAKGQAYVRQGLLKATVITPPLAGMALEMLMNGFYARTQLPEQTMVSAESFPALEILQPTLPAPAGFLSGNMLRQ